MTQGKWMYFEESYNDVFILPNKQYGVEFLVDGLSASTATFTSAAYTGTGATTGDCNITITAPTGTNVKSGSRYFYKADASTAPTALGYGEDATTALLADCCLGHYTRDELHASVFLPQPVPEKEPKGKRGGPKKKAA